MLNVAFEIILLHNLLLSTKQGIRNKSTKTYKEASPLSRWAIIWTMRLNLSWIYIFI